MPQRLTRKDAVAQCKSIWFVIWRSEIRAQPGLNSFSKTSPENSGRDENSAEISGTNGINFFCYMYESSLRHPVRVPEINVKACNSVCCLSKSNFLSAKVGRLEKTDDGYMSASLPQDADPPPPPYPTGIGERLCQTISIMCLAAPLRRLLL